MRLPAFLLFTGAVSLLAQNPETKLACDDGNHWNKGYRECQMKEWTVPATGRLSIDAGQNGGVRVTGSSRSDVLVRAKIETWAPSESEANGMQSQVNVQTAGGQVRATGPEFGRDRGYSVSFEVLVPQRLDISAKAHNGGIAIQDVNGRIEFDTTNGGVKLARLAGSVKGQTVNGGLSIELDGTRWDGDSLEARTTNGGISLKVPANYSARLETGTVNGGFHSEIEATVKGEIGKTMNLTLGSGGPLIRVMTTNGGVNIRRS